MKQGRCPRIEYSEDHEVGLCVEECMDDMDCDGGAKCCMNACGGRTCQEPEMDMEGKVDIISRLQMEIVSGCDITE